MIVNSPSTLVSIFSILHILPFSLSWVEKLAKSCVPFSRREAFLSSEMLYFPHMIYLYSLLMALWRGSKPSGTYALAHAHIVGGSLLLISPGIASSDVSVSNAIT